MGPSSREINGARLPPLKVHRDSHLNQKSSSASGSGSSSSFTAATSSSNRRHPVIIYTHSPKVIHTHASDFMALVQKLTGRPQSPSDEDDSSADHSPAAAAPPLAPPPKKLRRDCGDVCAGVRAVQQDDSSTSSENYSDGHVSCSTLSTAATVPPIGFEPFPPPNPYLSDMPLFAPSSSTSDYFCSPGELYRYPECSQVFPASIHDVAPSIMDTMKAYNDY